MPKIGINLDEEDESHNNEGLERFFNATKDSSKKFYTFKRVSDDTLEAKAIGISRAATIYGEGNFIVGELDIREADERDPYGEPSITNKFERNGFVFVKKIEE